MNNYKPRIFISCIYKLEQESPQKKIKDEIIKRVAEAGFEPQIFLESGLLLMQPWNFNTVHEILQRCQGAIILGLSKWTFGMEDNQSLKMPTEYNHYEGSLALARKLPTLILLEEGLHERGIFYSGGGNIYAHIPTNAAPDWYRTGIFKSIFDVWQYQVKSRYEVFLGYSGAAKSTAQAIISYLTGRLNLRVKEYGTGFRSGGTIMEEIEEACNTCICGIFLFTADDPLEGEANIASPRDNVIFEAGYFMKAKGKERTLIIREQGAKMPADIGGNIYLHLKDRKDISTITSDIQYFIEMRL